MDALLCHESPSEFILKEMEEGNVGDFNEISLTRLDASVKIACEARMHSGERLTFLLAVLTQDMPSDPRRGFLSSIECHEWLIKEVEAHHNNQC
jgi:hypothetical protein